MYYCLDRRVETAKDHFSNSLTGTLISVLYDK